MTACGGAVRCVLVWRWRHRAPTAHTTCSRDPSLLVEIEGKFQVGSLVFGTNPRTLPTVSSTNPLYINIHFGGIGVGRAGGAKNSRSCFLRLSFAQRFWPRSLLLVESIYQQAELILRDLTDPSQKSNHVGYHRRRHLPIPPLHPLVRLVRLQVCTGARATRVRRVRSKFTTLVACGLFYSYSRTFHSNMPG